METVNNLTAVASRVIFGTTPSNTTAAGEEPVSGQLGDVQKGEPYDKGNLDLEKVEASEPIAGEKGDVKKGEPFEMGIAESQPKSADTSGIGQSDKDVASGSATERTPDAFKGPGPKPVDVKTDGEETSKDQLNTEVGKVSKDVEGRTAEGTSDNPSAINPTNGNFDTGAPIPGLPADSSSADKEKSNEPDNKQSTEFDSKKAAFSDAKVPPKKEKTSLKDKIKAKLHKNKG